MFGDWLEENWCLNVSFNYSYINSPKMHVCCKFGQNKARGVDARPKGLQNTVVL